MQISDGAYMSVEILVRLAAQRGGSPCTMRGIAEEIDRSIPYTQTLIGRLRMAGLVKAEHGSGGGYTLARPADRITVAEVLGAIGEMYNRPDRSLSAVTFDAKTIEAVLAANVMWEPLQKHLLLLFLDRISLADIASENDGGSNRGQAKRATTWPHRPLAGVVRAKPH